MKKINQRWLLILIIILILVIIVIILNFGLKEKRKGVLENPYGDKIQIKIPKGKQEYTIVQEENVYPKFLKAVVNPVDVKPGDVQKYEVILIDQIEISKVIAYIERDSGTTTLELEKTYQGPISFEDLNQKYLVINKKLVLNNGSIKPVFAQEKKLQKFIYQGEWKVIDTHSKTYRTKIIAQNIKGEKNEITLTWTDPCTPPPCGDWAVDGNCAFSSNNGVENGNVTGFNSAYTVTLNATFIVNEGYSITINNGGSFAIGTGVQIKFGKIYVRDNDGDGYGNMNDQIVGSATGYVARALKCAYDCYDANANAYPGQANYFTTHRGDGSFDYDCDGGINQAGITCNNCPLNGWPSACKQDVISGFDPDASIYCGAGPYGYCSHGYCSAYCPANGNPNDCPFFSDPACSNNYYVGCK